MIIINIIIIIMIIISIHVVKEDSIFSMNASLPYGPLMNTDIDQDVFCSPELKAYQTISHFQVSLFSNQGTCTLPSVL